MVSKLWYLGLAFFSLFFYHFERFKSFRNVKNKGGGRMEKLLKEIVETTSTKDPKLDKRIVRAIVLGNLEELAKERESLDKLDIARVSSMLLREGAMFLSIVPRAKDIPLMALAQKLLNDGYRWMKPKAEELSGLVF